MTTFTASNGIEVIELKDGQIGYRKPLPGILDRVGGWLTPEEVEAFSEFVLSRAVEGIDREKVALIWHEDGNGEGSWDRAADHIRELVLERADALLAALPALLGVEKP